MDNEIFLRQVAQRALADAALQDRDAAMGGISINHGGSTLKRDAETFLCGLGHRLPPQWKSYAEQVEREADPEYDDWVRLSKKFGINVGKGAGK